MASHSVTPDMVAVTYRAVRAFVAAVDRLPAELRSTFELLFRAALEDSAVGVFERFSEADRLEDLHTLLQDAEDLGMERVDEITRRLMVWEHEVTEAYLRASYEGTR